MAIDYAGFLFGKGMPRSGEKILKDRAEKAVELKVRKKVNQRDSHRCFNVYTSARGQRSCRQCALARAINQRRRDAGQIPWPLPKRQQVKV